MEWLKVEIKREAFSWYDSYSFWDELNISKVKHVALKILSTNKYLIIQKLDKGKSVVLLNRNDYIKQMNEMLSDSSKFKKLDIKPTKEINGLLQQEDRLTNFLKKVKESVVISHVFMIKRYVDDILVLFNKPEHVQFFLQ